jgi:hypothetical protein
MAVALHEPDLIANIVSVDNAPVDVRLAGDFARYIQGMQKIDEAGVTRQADADKILEPYEKVSLLFQLFLPLHPPLVIRKPPNPTNSQPPQSP